MAEDISPTCLDWDINRLVLSIIDFLDPRFLTFLQAQNLGGGLTYGAKGFPVVLCHLLHTEAPAPRPDPVGKELYGVQCRAV